MVHEEIFPTKRGESIILDGQGIKAYDIRTITLGQLRLLIACGNDSRNNQIRVTKSGMVYLSEDTVGAEQLDDVAFSFGTPGTVQLPYPDREIVDVSCRSERAGGGTAGLNRRADESRRGSDRGTESPKPA